MSPHVGRRTRRRSRKRRKSRTGKRTVNKKLSKRAKTIYVGPGQIYAPRLMTRMKWRDVNTHTALAATPNYYTYRANSVQTFNPGDVNHQPYGFDEFANAYVKYRVLKLQFKIQFANIVSGACEVGVRVQNNIAYYPTVWRNFLEVPGTQYRLLSGTSGGPTTCTISGSFDLARVAGMTKAQYGSNEYTEAIWNADPVEQMFLVIGLFSPAGTGGITYQISCWLTTEWFDPIDQLPS